MSKSTIGDGTGAIDRSVSRIYQLSSSQGALVWNDETPTGRDNPDTAHSKGVIYFDGNSGMYFLHSAPKFPPASGPYSYPETATDYGQSFICLSLGQRDVGQVMSSLIVTRPQLYITKASSTLQRTYLALGSVMAGNFTSQPLGTSYAVTTQQGVSFTLFAKNREWDSYLYEDLIAPTLNSDLICETWTLGRTSDIMPTFCRNHTTRYNVYNAMHISMGGVTWSRNKDHSKWAVGVHNDYFCIGSINREYSQAKRGGGACCTSQIPLQQYFYQSVIDVNACGTASVTTHGSQPPASLTGVNDPVGVAAAPKVVKANIMA